MVLHMSAQSRHIAAHFAISPDIIELSAQRVQACSHAEQASTISFIAIMSMPGTAVMESIILEVMFIRGKSDPAATSPAIASPEP